MTHEFKEIVKAYQEASTLGIKAVLATVVALDGSSYRKAGVRMLILGNGEMIGAVSGGCVEKEVLRQSASVFKDGQSKVMTYDGRFRLGCEGILYILLEVFHPDYDFHEAFNTCLKNRKHFHINSYYSKNEGVQTGLGSQIIIENKVYSISENIIELQKNEVKMFSQKMKPCFKLLIFGAEHDAVQLCKLASFNGWEVEVYSGACEAKELSNFPGATSFHSIFPDDINLSAVDNQTAVMIMTHSFANDLKYLSTIKDTNPIYIGLLGPTHKRENLLSHLLEYHPEIDVSFLEKIHGPAGLNIGAETPQEIAVSIISEILAITRSQQPMHLNKKPGGIHDLLLKKEETIE